MYERSDSFKVVLNQFFFFSLSYVFSKLTYSVNVVFVVQRPIRACHCTKSVLLWWKEACSR